MLSSIYRLSRNDFDKVKRDGRLYQSENFGAQVLHKELGGISRFAFIISTKISGHAIQRNRIKRAMSEAVRDRMNLFKRGYDIIFLPKKQITKKSTDEIMNEIHDFVTQKLSE
jgi:ribonuclease P protein component